MGIVRKFKDAARWVENVSEFEAPRPAPEPETTPPAAPEPPEDPRAARLARGLRRSLRLHLAAVTAGAVLLSTAGCRTGEDGTPAARPTCDEPASWCDAGAQR
ncbi:hypothetical protein [Amycolatopsis plumensis]|uniref:Uncharacterized protein n=1 Tax=Amycolatopsis plumensis TaxID=236508 RepID=A0ABV5U943_9PSEU